MPFGFKPVSKLSIQPSSSMERSRPAYLAESGKKNLLGLPLKQVGLLVLGGFLMGIAPVNAWPLAWFALIPLWQIVFQPHLPIRSALVGAALWGMAYHGTALSWIVWWLKPLLSMGLPLIAGVPITLFAWAFITIWGAAIGMGWIMLMHQLSRWRMLSGWQQVLVGTALWCALEWLWSRGPLYWSPLSYTQSPYNLLGLQLGQLAGPLTVTAGIVAVNGLLAAGLRLQASGQASGRVSAQASAQEKIEKSFKGKAAQVTAVPVVVAQRRKMLGLGLALFLCFHLVGLALYVRPLADMPERGLTVGLVQGNIPTSEKLSPMGVQESRQVYLEGYETLVAAGADLVITPEGSIAQTWNTFMQDRDLLMRAVVRNKVPLLLGTFARQNVGHNQGKSTQSLLMLSPEAKVVGRYNKVKLVPLGEYLPFEPLLRAVMGPLLPWSSLAPGRFDQQLETPFGPMAAGICYESAFTGLFRAQVARGGQAIFTASNNDPYPTRQMMQHHAQDVMRAIETDRWAVRVTNTGISGVVDPRGRSRWLSTPNERVVHASQIYLRQSRTPYVRWGDWLTPLLLAIALVILSKTAVCS
ncbi:MAG: apolipoprotein N-acyltransferase [Phormidesmis sp.]